MTDHGAGIGTVKCRVTRVEAAHAVNRKCRLISDSVACFAGTQREWGDAAY
jgi:hypothetical protein